MGTPAPQTAASTAGAQQHSELHAVESVRHPLTMTLLALTFTTGIVDAVSYLGLGRVFAANMTGNVVLLGFGIAGGAKLPVLAPIIALGVFLAGAALGGRISGRLAQRRPLHVSAALAIEVAFILVAVAIALGTHTRLRPGSVPADAIIAVLAFAMGVRNATVKRIAVPDLTTTVLTMTLTGLAAESWLGGGSGKGTTRRTLAVLTMLLGAVAGALMVKTSIVTPLAAAAGVLVLSWCLYFPTTRQERRASSSITRQERRAGS